MNSLAFPTNSHFGLRQILLLAGLMLWGVATASAQGARAQNQSASASVTGLVTDVVVAEPVAQLVPEGETEENGDLESGDLENGDLDKQEFNACEALEEGALFKPIEQIRTILTDDGERMPPDCSEQFFTEQLDGASPRFVTQMPFHWQPTNFFHMPTYFDDVPLERYGQHHHPILQPFVSGTRFVLQVPVLPYKMAIDPPHSCITTLGHRPPGDCVPCIRQRLPREANASLVQAAATVGLAFILP